ncbi:AraC family transcriptional regulator [Flavobacterium sp.]|uniref:helix-turn-helix domain-containing protein n=1 Tax=Flavobacterium sp. TaxID=239 RepID=UPI001222A934|nr:AraC family transcriptional regulator [Flavobacterium sp.]RZJ72304.1 MAG: AraC family transcriptional regulator [Flavobacterium sp.]
MELRVKNMVCDRCKMVVRNTFEELGFAPVLVELGVVELSKSLSDAQKSRVDAALHKFGFELIDDKKTQTVEKIKNLIVGLVHQDSNALKVNLSDYLVSRINQDYSALSNLFSQQNGKTIEQFYILQKIERVKELLEYGEFNLNEIADNLNYSSASHLTRQFKKVTGQTPSEFRNSRGSRISLNEL